LTPGGKVNFRIVGQKRLEQETCIFSASVVVGKVLCLPSPFPFRYLPKARQLSSARNGEGTHQY
jgi:hypothetical protein